MRAGLGGGGGGGGGAGLATTGGGAGGGASTTSSFPHLNHPPLIPRHVQPLREIPRHTMNNARQNDLIIVRPPLIVVSLFAHSPHLSNHLNHRFNILSKAQHHPLNRFEHGTIDIDARFRKGQINHKSIRNNELTLIKYDYIPVTSIRRCSIRRIRFNDGEGFGNVRRSRKRTEPGRRVSTRCPAGRARRNAAVTRSLVLA